MPRLLAVTHERLPTETCVWMDAGVVGYKLCDRGFDCASCPLDAALRGVPPSVGAGSGEDPSATRPLAFPEDRRYPSGHVWLGRSPRGTARRRLGLDAFASRLIGTPRGIVCNGEVGSASAGRRVCVVELAEGGVPIALPGPGRACAWNTALLDDPARLVASPYGKGWLVEWIPDDPVACDSQPGAGDARRRAALDARHFYRRVAFELLAGTRRGIASDRVGGEIRRLLGPSVYLSLVRELVH
jgi:glycine cleavage system H lipoate-binding protein